MPRHPVAPHDGVCHQGMRCQDTGEQQGSAQTETQQGHTYPHPDSKGDTEGQEAEQERLGKILLQVLQVHFQTGQEHDIIDTHLAEQLETTVPFQDIETILAYHHPGQNHADDMGDTQASQHDRSKKDNHQHQEEYPSRVCNR